jgi:prepilin-type processing-associated H-X9-DG protein
LHDDVLRSRLQALGVDADTWHVVGLLPLVQVAWADGHVHDAERKSIMDRARAGMPLDEHALRLVEGWLTWRPSPAYFARGQEVLRTLAARGVTSGDVRSGCEAVAEAAGGVFGRFGRVSAEERAVIDAVVASLGKTDAWDQFVNSELADDDADDERTLVGVPYERVVSAPRHGVAPPCIEVQGGEVIPLTGPLSVGRQAGNDLALAGDAMVSRRHCRFVVEGGRWSVLDCGSVNGTFVDDERVLGRRLFGGERVRVGDTHLRVVLRAP